MNIFQKAAKSAGINIAGGFYQEPGIVSVGGRIDTRRGEAGGTIGYDADKKRMFGSVNVNGKIVRQFGPPEED